MKTIQPYFLFFGICLAGCGCPKPVVAGATQTVVRDTVFVEKTVRIRDTILKIEPREVRVEVPVKDVVVRQAHQPLIQHQDKVRVVVQTIRDTLRITATCDSLAIRAQLREEWSREVQAKETVKTVVHQERYTPFVTKLLAWVGGLGLLTVAGRIIIKKYLL